MDDSRPNNDTAAPTPDVQPPGGVPEGVPAPEPAPREPAAEVHAGPAGRAFLRALGRDTASFAGRFRRRAQRWRVEGPVMPIHPEPAAPQQRRRKSAGWRVFTGLVKTLLIVAALAAVAGGGLVAWAVYDVPLDRSVAAATAPSMVLEAADGQSLGRRGPFRVADVALADFPEVLVDAVLSIEDRRFFTHPGFDVFGIARAFSENASAGHVVEGGSTITQQLVKGMLGDDERTMRRKLREAMVAVAIEFRLGKPEILHRYLNAIYMGGGAFGMPAAAQLYFGKGVKDLTIAEAAMLAGLIHAPSQLNPLVNLAAAQTRAGEVLGAMVENAVITADAAAAAKATPAVPTRSAQQMIDGTWFADWVADEAGKFTGSNGGPIKVRTTLVPGLQKIAEEVIRDALAKSGKAAHASQAALVAMRSDGAVLAMVGGSDYQANQFNRAAQAKRQPGSSFKLFVYLAALRAGYTPDSTVEDAPLSIKDPTTGKLWTPDNYGDQYYGSVTLADAFARSLNTAAVRLAVAAGPDKVVAAARDLGIDAPLSAYPSIALGTNEVTLVDLTAAYASVLSGIMPVQPWGIAGVGAAGKDGLSLSAGSPVDKGRTLDHRAELISLLQGVVQHGTARGAALPGFAAGKTGTTQDYRDAWFIGFDRSLVVGVWVGNDDNASMERVTGGSLPASIWKAFMTAAAPYENGIVVPLPTATATPGAAIVAFAPSDIGTAPACDIATCSATYQSFRASDCTFQPYFGPRQVCTKGTPTAAMTTAPGVVAALPPPSGVLPPVPAATPLPPQPSAFPPVSPSAPPAPQPPPFPPVAAVPPPASQPPAFPPVPVPAPAAAATPVPPGLVPQAPLPAPPVQSQGPIATLPPAGSCDVAACSQMYSSFRASDCTFQPFGGGPRQICTRPTAPAPGPATFAGPVLPAGPLPPQQIVPPPQPAAPPQNGRAQSVPKSILDWLSGQPAPPPGY